MTTDHEFVAEATVQNLSEAAARLAKGAERLLLVLVAETGAPDLDALVAELGASLPEAPFVGGIFPALIVGTTKHERGAIVLALPAAGMPFVVTEQDARRGRLEARLRPQGGATAIVLVDGLARRISGFLEALYDSLGNTVAYWGGGAGSLSLEQQRCVFCRQGVFQDVAIVALSTLPATLGVQHGWTEFLGPLVATRTHGNRISELNWGRAYDSYREAILDDSDQELTEAGFFDVAKGYPLGLRKQGAEHVVRDPIAVDEDGALVCVGDVPENASLSILKGSPDKLIAAAGRAAESACKATVEARLSLVADCISRVIFLEERFPEELLAMEAAAARTATRATQLGMLTLGEISSYGQGYLEFFNKTAVVASLPLSTPPLSTLPSAPDEP